MEKETLKMTTEEGYRFAKQLMLTPIVRLYEIAKFETNVMEPPYTDIFYELAIELNNKYKVEPNNFPYYAKNYGAYNANTITELSQYLEESQQNLGRNDSRYSSGFRSIYFILYNNIDSIEPDEICSILGKLKPFFQAYEMKHILIPGVQH